MEGTKHISGKIYEEFYENSPQRAPNFLKISQQPMETFSQATGFLQTVIPIWSDTNINPKALVTMPLVYWKGDNFSASEHDNIVSDA